VNTSISRRLLSSVALALSVTACSMQSLRTESEKAAEGNNTKDFHNRLAYVAGVGKYDNADIEAEIHFGRELAARVLGSYPLLDDPELHYYVNKVGKSLALNSARPELEFRFGILDSASVNAYATPGGYVLVTQGAIDQMQDEAELAGVLAHEIAHTTERHIVKELKIKGSGEEGGMSTILAGNTQTMKVAFKQALGQAMGMLFEGGLKQKQDEFDSDRVGTLLMVQAGYDPNGLKRYLQRIARLRGEQVSVVNSTHPSFTNRLERLDSLFKKEQLSELPPTNMAKRFHQQTGTGFIYVLAENAYKNRLNDEVLQAERQYGHLLTSKLLQRYPLLVEGQTQHYVNLVGQTLVRKMASSHVFRFAVLDTPVINSYATPSGHVLVTRGAVDLAADESQLAALLAREIAHVNQRDLLHGVWPTGKESDSSQASPAGATESGLGVLLESGHNDQVAFETDLITVMLLKEAGYDPMALRRYLEKVQNFNGSSMAQFKQTHPDLSTRLARLQQFEKQQKFVQAKRLETRFYEGYGSEFLAEGLANSSQFGRNMAMRVLDRYPLWHDDKIWRYLNLVGQTVARKAGLSGSFRFAALDSPDVDSYAIPGGLIFITRGQLNALNDEAELAALLTQNMLQMSRYTDKGGYHTPQEAYDSVWSFWKTTQTSVAIQQADRDTLTVLLKSGYDPAALQRYVERLSMTDYPQWKQRLADLQTLSKQKQFSSMKRPTLEDRFNDHLAG
jgi:beta-barrel assembly-enhancing protease